MCIKNEKEEYLESLVDEFLLRATRQLGSRQIERNNIARDSIGDLYAMLESSKMK